METMNDRIGNLISALGIKKTAFAERLKVSQQYISKLIRTGTPSDLLIEDICQKFNVNEQWLRDGSGEMFSDISEDTELAEIVNDILEPNSVFYDTILSIIKSYRKLDSAGKEVVNNLIDDALSNLHNKKEEE